MPQRSYISPKQWEKYYKELPHWAVSLKPSKLAFSFIKFLKKHRITKGKILEVGCGNGRDSFFFACHRFNVIGIDIAPEAIALCKKNKTAFTKKRIIKRPQIKFLVTKAEKLPFKEKSFIGAYSIGVLHNTNLEKSLRELARVIKNNGLIVIHLYEKTIFLPTKKVEKYYSSREIKNILIKLPFHILKFESNITRKKSDYDEEAGWHKHFAIILYLKKA